MNRWVKMMVAGLALGLALGATGTGLWRSASQPTRRGEPLYFAMVVSRGGTVVARPQLVGEVGKSVRVLLRYRDGSERMALALQPAADGDRYGVDLQLDLPRTRGLKARVSFAHGQEQQVHLGDGVDVSLLLMRVRSPEFEAYVRESPLFDQAALRL